MVYREPAEVVQILGEIYELKFGGKRRGKYRITRVDLRKLAGRKKLHATIVEEIKDLMLESGYLMGEVADYFVLIDVRVIEGYRKLPRAILKPYWEEDEDEEAAKGTAEEGEEED